MRRRLFEGFPGPCALGKHSVSELQPQPSLQCLKCSDSLSAVDTLAMNFYSAYLSSQSSWRHRSAPLDWSEDDFFFLSLMFSIISPLNFRKFKVTFKCGVVFSLRDQSCIHAGWFCKTWDLLTASWGTGCFGKLRVPFWFQMPSLIALSCLVQHMHQNGGECVYTPGCMDPAIRDSSALGTRSRCHE